MMKKVFVLAISFSAIHAAADSVYLRGGMLASNTFYRDATITPGLYTGFFRPWAKVGVGENLEFFARGNLTLKQYLQKVGTLQQTTVVGALEIFSGEIKIQKHRFTAGRSFVLLDQGLLFANFADGVSYQGSFRYGTVKANAMYSGDYGSSLCPLNVTGCNGDPSPFVNTPSLAPDSGIQNSGQRLFAAAEYNSPELFGQKLVVYGLYSKDLIKESATNSLRYEYNPYYAGGGFRGYIMNSRYAYRVDGIYQGGNTYNFISNGTSSQVTVQAYAALANVNVVLPVLPIIDPQVSGEFAMGSGDGDAIKATTAQSNTAGNYTGFQNFGAYSGGLALKPRLTNLQVYRAGVALRPFKKWYMFKDLGLQLKGTLYRKTVSSGAISDPAATVDNSDVGIAGDAALVMNVVTDVQFFYGYGLFKPGGAYTDQTLRHAHLISLTLVF